MSLNSTQRVQKVFELIRIKGGKEYQDYVPALSDKSPISDVGTPVLTNPLVFKQFTSLLGAFIEYRVWKDAWSNPLSQMIMKNGQPFGEFSGDVANNPVVPRQYDPTHPERVLDYAVTQDYVAFYARNVKELFKLSIPYEDMKGAFQSYEKFDEYIQMKLSSLETGYQLSMFNHIFEAIVTNYNAGVFVESDFHIPETPTTDDYAKFTTLVKSLTQKFQYISSDYNHYSILEGALGEFKGYSKKEDIYVIGTIDWMTENNVKYLASIFNLEKAEIENRIIAVPEFAYTYWDYDDNGNPTTEHKVSCPIECMVVDQRAFSFKRDLDLDASMFNEQTLVTNYFKHFWATYSISPFANCVVFTKNIDQDITTSIYVADYGNSEGERFIDIKSIGAKQTLTMGTVPDNPIPLGRVSFTVADIVSNFDEPIDVDTLNTNLSNYIKLPNTDEQTPLKYTFTGVVDESADSATVILNMRFDILNPIITIPIIAVLYKPAG